MTIVTVCSIPSCANSFDSFVYYHCLGILVWLNYTRPVSDIVFDGACDRINDKMDSLDEAQADRAIEKSREAEIESWEHAHGSQDSHYHHDGDNDHHHGSKSGGSESSHPTSPRLGFAGALSRHLTGALPLTSRSSTAVPATPKPHATSPAMEDNSAPRKQSLPPSKTGSPSSSRSPLARSCPPVPACPSNVQTALLCVAIVLNRKTKAGLSQQHPHVVLAVVAHSSSKQWRTSATLPVDVTTRVDQQLQHGNSTVVHTLVHHSVPVGISAEGQ